MDREEKILVGESVLSPSAEYRAASLRCGEDVGSEVELPRAESAGLECGLEPSLAFVQGLDAQPSLKLSAAAAHRGMCDADKCRGMKRPLEEADIAENLRQARGGGVAFGSTPAMGEDDKRHIRPAGLIPDPFGKRFQICGTERLFRQNDKSRVLADPLQQLL
ncbi:hypothetical protein FHT77_003527 [Rhizobium sp. BK181]|nr:hypothetical protein [Rhizobium sp. BK181]